MSRKRNRNGGRGGTGVPSREGGWDALPWRAIEPPLERDDGWKGMGGEEQVVMYTLEEISGNDYALEKDTTGASQMVFNETGSSPDAHAADTSRGNKDATAVAVVESAAKETGQKTRSKKKSKKTRKDSAEKASATAGGAKKGNKAGANIDFMEVVQSTTTNANPAAIVSASSTADNKEKSSTPRSASAHAPSVSAASPASCGATLGTDNTVSDGHVPSSVGSRVTDKDDGDIGHKNNTAVATETRPKRKKRRGKGTEKKARAKAAAAAMAPPLGRESGTCAEQTDSAAIDGDNSPAVANDEQESGNEAISGRGAPRSISSAAVSNFIGSIGSVNPEAADATSIPTAAVGASNTAVEATVLATGGDKKVQVLQVQGADKDASEVAASAAAPVVAASDSKLRSSEGGTPKLTRNQRKKLKKKNKLNKELGVGGREQGEAAAGEGGNDMSRTRNDGWELEAEESAKMLPWTYLGVELHPALMWHLHRQGFHDPTPIQKRVLPKAILGRKDIIGAAETGSGKTLAYGLPLLSEILARRDAVAVSAAAREIDAGVLTRGEADAGDGDADDGHRVGMDGEKKEQQGLQALVLCPTRELALQVAAHLREVVGGTGLAVVAIVGGLAEVKQERQLSRRPEVVVATPGRFWELAGTHAHLSRLETLRHLVVDEADRMLETGHYPELKRLFSLLDRADGRDTAPEEEGVVGGEGGEGGSRVGGASKRARKISGSVSSGGNIGKRDRKFAVPFALGGDSPFDVNEGGEWSLPSEWTGSTAADPDDGGDDEDDPMGDESGAMKDMPQRFLSQTTPAGNVPSPVCAPPLDERGIPTPTSAAVPKHPHNFGRQTYVFSATLTLASTGRQQRRKKGGRKAAHAPKSADDPVANIMKRVGVRGEPAVIDMGKRSIGGVEGGGGSEDVEGAGEQATAAPPPALPAGLRLCSLKSLQMDKDVHTYLFCAMYPGRTLIFVNAIACARRVAAVLCALKIPATPLHAQMQQRQRLKSLDRFTSDPKAVLVATDVAARGLDIPKVEHVVHYDAARSAEVFIHRAGRTARARAAGLSLSIVAPRDDANHRQTCKVLSLHEGMMAFPQDVRLVERARERVGMALRVLKFQEQQNKVSASNDFFRGLSRDADLVIDNDLLQDAPDGKQGTPQNGRTGGLGKKGNQHAARLAAEARTALEASLSRPLHSDRRKLIPVAQALAEMEHGSTRTAAGDLVADQKARRARLAKS